MNRTLSVGPQLVPRTLNIYIHTYSVQIIKAYNWTSQSLFSFLRVACAENETLVEVTKTVDRSSVGCFSELLQ